MSGQKQNVEFVQLCLSMSLSLNGYISIKRFPNASSLCQPDVKHFHIEIKKIKIPWQSYRQW